MTNVILLKILSETKVGYRGLFLLPASGVYEKSKQIHLYGDFPDLPKGTTLKVDYTWDAEKEKGLITKYEIPFSERNVKLFEKNIPEFDLERFQKKISFHQSTGTLWRKIKAALENPYAYYSFTKADVIYYKTGQKADDKLRLKALKDEIIKLERKHRHENMTIEEYLKYFNRLELKSPFASLPLYKKMELIGDDEFLFVDTKIQDLELLEAGTYIQQNMFFRNRIATDLLTEDEIEEAVIGGLDEEQIEAINCLKTTKPSIVTGGAGAGKTTVINTIMQCYSQARPDHDILLLAPTGRASRRLEEVTGHPASTIHKALRLIPGEDGELEFNYFSAENRLPHELVIVDEASMIDTLLMAQLLKCLNDDTKIIFVGDHQQLYPVGVGEPFFDFMNSEYCDVYKLLHNHRQSKNDIGKNAMHAIRGEEFEQGVGVRIAEVPIRRIPRLLRLIEEKNGALASPSQVQIMSPFNKVNSFINSILQKSEIPKDENEKRPKFAVNDKVIAIRNTEDYCNGDIGFVVAVPERGLDIQFEDGRRLHVDQQNLDDIQLAYSITVHKMQGSESKRIYLFLPKEKSPFIEARMLYTAVTRAKDELFIYYYYNDKTA